MSKRAEGYIKRIRWRREAEWIRRGMERAEQIRKANAEVEVPDGRFWALAFTVLAAENIEPPGAPPIVCFN